MCGRVACYLDSSTLATITKTHQLKNNQNYNRSYNLAPTSFLPAVFKTKSINSTDNSDTRERELEAIKWGTYRKDGTAIINARVESLNYINQYKQSIARSQTCAIIIQGYYEWKEENGIKEPYYISSSNQSYMILCGLYFYDETLEDPIKELVIITNEAIKGLEFIHDRSPLLLNETLMEEWISISNLKRYNEVLNKLKSYNNSKENLNLCYRIVGNLVNKLSNKGEDCTISKEDLKYDQNKNFTLKGFFEKVNQDNKILKISKTNPMLNSGETKENNQTESLIDIRIKEFNKINLITSDDNKNNKSDKSSILDTTQSSTVEIKTAKKNKRNKIKCHINNEEIFLRNYLNKSGSKN